MGDDGAQVGVLRWVVRGCEDCGCGVGVLK
jgi:hypothetical protein